MLDLLRMNLLPDIDNIPGAKISAPLNTAFAHATSTITSYSHNLSLTSWFHLLTTIQSLMILWIKTLGANLFFVSASCKIRFFFIDITLILIITSKNNITSISCFSITLTISSTTYLLTLTLNVEKPGAFRNHE